MHDRDRSQAAAEPGSDHAPECPADRRAGQQQPKADAAQPQPLLANRTRTALWAAVATWTPASRSANARSTRCANSQPSPSAISARRPVRRPAAAAAPPGVARRAGLAAIRAELAANETASTANGIQADAENRNPPAGGPASCSATIRVPASRPLARSSRPPGRGRPGPG